MNYRFRYVLTVGLLLSFSSCTGLTLDGERAEQQRLAVVSAAFDSINVERPSEASSLSKLVLFAVFRSPSVRASFHEWAASVARITVARSLPDPMITLDAEVSDTLMSLMPGLMAMQFPGPGKPVAEGRVASAESQVKYYQFQRAVLEAAVGVEISYHEVAAALETIAVTKKNLEILGDLESISRMQHGTGRATLQDVLRIGMEKEQLETELRNLNDSLAPLRARFNAALGLNPDSLEAAPFPRVLTAPREVPDIEVLRLRAFERNPRLRAIEAEIRAAEAGITRARRSQLPDITVGIDVDVKASPTIVSPFAWISIPVWRDKIAARIAEAMSMKAAADARLTVEQLALVTELAVASFMYREASRDVELLNRALVPKAEQSLEIARIGYVGGQSSFVDLLGAEQSLLKFQISRIDALKRRNTALSNLSLIVVGKLPAGAEKLDV